MSVHWSSYVWSNSPYEGTKLLLHLALADMSNDEGVCWPSVDTLQKRIRRDRRQVFRLIAEMMDEGFLQNKTRCRDDGSQTSNLYQLLVPEADVTLGDVTDDIPRDDMDDIGRVTPVTSHESSLEPPQETKDSHAPLSRGRDGKQITGGGTETIEGEDGASTKNYTELELKIMAATRSNKLTDNQAQLLRDPIRSVYMDGNKPKTVEDIPPIEKYAQDATFQLFVDYVIQIRRKDIKWPKGPNRTDIINHIRDYGREMTGWLAWKKEHGEVYVPPPMVPRKDENDFTAILTERLKQKARENAAQEN